MHAASRLDFEPPRPREGTLRAYGLALLIHGLLLAALTWGVSWRRSDNSVAVEAELWSAVPQEAAPKLVEPEPQPQPAPPPPPPPPKVEQHQPNEAEIALARERERKAREQAEQEKREKERLERERQEHERKLAEEKKKKELEAKRKEQEEARLREQLRKDNLKRMAGLAGATGAPTATGTAQRSAGPSANYAARIRARIKPNIVFPDELSTNPSAEVEVRTSPDGTIVGRKLLRSSGVPSWDEAVLKAIDKTEVLPRNEDGVVPSPMTIIFRPKD